MEGMLGLSRRGMSFLGTIERSTVTNGPNYTGEMYHANEFKMNHFPHFSLKSQHEDELPVDHLPAPAGPAPGQPGADASAVDQAGRHGQAEGEELPRGRLREEALHGGAGEAEGVQEQAVRQALQDGPGDEEGGRRHQGAEQAAAGAAAVAGDQWQRESQGVQEGPQASI